MSGSLFAPAGFGRIVSSSLCLAMLLALVGCATRYTYGDATYSSREEAVAGARQDLDAMLADVPPVADPLGGRTLAVIPTREVIESDGVQTTGPSTSDGVGYVVDGVEMTFLAIVDSVRIGAVFDEVVLSRADITEDVPYDGYDYKLWLQPHSLTDWRWYLADDTGQQERLIMDMTGITPDLMVRFNDDIVRAGRKLEGN